MMPSSNFWKCLSIGLGVVASVFLCLWIYASTTKREKEIQLRKLELQTRADSIHLDQLSKNLEKYDRYGDSDPRHVSATFAKTAEEREVKVRVTLNCSALWRLAKPLDNPNSVYNKGKPYEITENQVTRCGVRDGVFLGTRSDTVFFMFGLLTSECDAIFHFRAAPAPVKIHPKGCYSWYDSYTERCAYSPILCSSTLNFSVESRFSKREWSGDQGSILHVWRQGGVTVLIVGFDEPNAASVPTLPYFRNGPEFLDMIEHKTVRYPVSSPNGAVCLLPLDFDRDYDHRGRVAPWNGSPGDVRLIFCPVDEVDKKKDRPTIHSYILQLDEGNSFWLPAYEVQNQLSAVQEHMDFNKWMELKARLVDASAVPVPLSQPEDAVSRRKKLIESFRSLIAQTVSP